MAQEKLLRALAFIIIIFFGLFISLAIAATVAEAEDSISSAVSQEDQEWAYQLGKNHRVEFLARMTDRAKEYFGEEEGMDMLKPRPSLQIFVSNSMPRSLLRNYAKEASIYGGVLVFRGLPDGSMIKLTRLVSDISDEDYPAAMQIDDDSFDMYGIDSVPAIILSQENGFGQIERVTPQHDKISGNVSIRYALEQFANKGSLSEKAIELLEEELSK